MKSKDLVEEMADRSIPTKYHWVTKMVIETVIVEVKVAGQSLVHLNPRRLSNRQPASARQSPPGFHSRWSPILVQ